MTAKMPRGFTTIFGWHPVKSKTHYNRRPYTMEGMIFLSLRET